jgi:hypothetical protein
LVDSAHTLNLSGNLATTLRPFVPIEPVDPKIAIFSRCIVTVEPCTIFDAAIVGYENGAGLTKELFVWTITSTACLQHHIIIKQI